MKPTNCPKCEGELIPCVYGYPSPELERKADAGKVKLMGCVARDHDPAYWCTRCGTYYWRPV